MKRALTFYLILAGWSTCQAMDSLDNQRTIKIRDWLSVEIVNDRKPAEIARVDNEGKMKPPYLAPLKAADLTCRSLAYNIKRELEKNYFHQNAVIVRFADKPKDAATITKENRSNTVAILTRMDVLDNVERIEPGHVLFFQIEGDGRHLAEPYDAVVSDNGEVIAPFLGGVKVVGVTPRKLAIYLKAELEKSHFSQATVLVSVSHPHPVRQAVDRTPHVLVFGSVAKQGKHRFPGSGNLTVSEVLQRAGGTTSKNKIPNIIIARKTLEGHKRILVNAKAVLIEKRAEYDLFLRRDDVIIVE